MRRLEGNRTALQLVDSEIVETNGEFTVYIIEEYCTPLIDVMQKKEFTFADCINVAIGTVEALIACRDAGVLHLDVQPKNIYFTGQGRICLGDFGNSLLIEDGSDRSRLRGTLAFMAPEVFRSRIYSERSDIYSVGVLLFYLLNGGVYPFTDAGTITEAVYRLLAGEPLPRIERLDPEQNRVTAEVLSSVCAFSPDERPRSFEELRSRLDELASMLAGFSPTGAVIPSRTVLPIIYVIDTSGSMAHGRIDAVNQAMRRALQMMREAACKNPDSEVRIAVLTFSSLAEWKTRDDSGEPALIRVEDLSWNNLIAGGMTSTGEALKELHDNMSRSSFFSEDIRYRMPVVIFLTDGEPTDDWQSVLDRVLANNMWFRHSTKICIAVGADANRDILAHIAGGPSGDPNREAVVDARDNSMLEKRSTLSP